MSKILKIYKFICIFLRSCKAHGVYISLCKARRAILEHVSSRKPHKLHFVTGVVNFSTKHHMRSFPLQLAKKNAITGHYTCLHGAGCDFSHSFSLILAHDDPEDIIDSYVEELCLHFKSLHFKVILVSARPLKNTPTLQRWSQYCDAIVYRTCPGGHFVSWKAAFDCFPSLYACTQLVLTNDTYFAMSSFGMVHERMQEVHCDFWGMTSSKNIYTYLSDYYMVLKENVLQSAYLQQFMAAIPLRAQKEFQYACINTFTSWLVSHGFIAAAFAHIPKTPFCYIDPAKSLYQELLSGGFPLLLQRNLNSVDGFTIFLLHKNDFTQHVRRQSANAYLQRMGSLPTKATNTNIRHRKTENGAVYKQYNYFPHDVTACYAPLQTLPEGDTLKDTPSLLVALHCFYPECLDSILSYLEHIPPYAHIYVTTDMIEKKKNIEQSLKNLSFAKIEIRTCPNRGWDMGAFFVGLRDVLLNYEYVLKIHVKKSTNLNATLVQHWRSVLYTSLLGSKERVAYIMGNLQHNPTLGVVAPPNYPPSSAPIQGVNHKNMHRLLASKNIFLPEDACIDFPVGGMFWCRSSVLRPWLELNLGFDDFAPTDTKQRNGTLAHALERLIFFGCAIETMTWGRVGMLSDAEQS